MKKRTETETKRLLFVYNPKAGRGAVVKNLHEIVDVFVKANYMVTVYATQEQGDACRLLQSGEAERYDLVVCSGGDGTLREAVNGLMKRGVNVPVGYIPAGSTNDFAGTIGLPIDVRRAAKMAVEGSPFFCDAGMLNDKFFAYVAAFGAFTSVSYDTAQEFKNLFGRTAYIVEGIRQLASIKELHLKITFDNGIIEDDFIFGMVTNSLQVGGMKNNLNTAVSLNDGLFEVLLVKKPKNAVGYQNIITSFLTQNIEKTTDIITFKAAKIKFESQEEIPWTVDGEFGGESTSTEITNLPKAFSVIV